MLESLHFSPTFGLLYDDESMQLSLGRC